MSEQPEDSNTSDGKVMERTASNYVGSITTSAEASVVFSADNIREKLGDGKYALALILTSTRLENIVSRAIRDHYSWSWERFENQGYDEYSLGALLEECVEYGALKEHEDELNKIRSGEMALVSLRNDLVHKYGYLSEIEEDKEVQQEVEDAIEDAIEFIEAVEI